MAEDISSFGQRLRQLREAAGLTQEELASRAGLTAKGIAALERGRRQRPYPHTVAALAGALGLADDARALLNGAAGQGREQPPAPPPAAASPALPVPPTPLIGREGDIAALLALLAEGARLITLLGPGGVGKTRLALAVAAATAFPDGATFVPLGPLDDPALVLPAIAGALGLHEAGKQSAGAVLRAHLAERRALLVIDNWEHLLEAAPEIAALLVACPDLAVLATSRAPLRLRGEREWTVAPLAPPVLDHLPIVAEIAENPAVRLFAERARDVNPDFALTQTDAAAIAAICRRLDGLPLALELAAARVRLLRPTELLARLDRALPLLAGGARDLPARQRTMRDTIAWSHDLLDGAGQALFRRLAVFAGGWDLAAAEAINPAGDLLGPLSGLVEQSLIVATIGDDAATPGASRYRLLAMMREFARERLEASGEAAEVRLRHADYYLALAERAGAGLAGPDQAAWIARLELESGNLRAAMTWALAAGRRDIATGLGWALHIFWATRGYNREGRQWMEAVLAAGPLAPLEEARALAAAGMMARMQGDYAIAAERLAGALARFRAIGDTAATLATFSRLGHVERLLGNHQRARELAAEGLALARAADDRAMIVWMLDVLGLVALAERDYPAAIGHIEEGLALAAETGDLRYMVGLRNNLGMAALGQGDYRQANLQGREALALLRQIGLRRIIAVAFDLLASAAVGLGHYARAARLYGAAEATREADGLAPWSAADQAIYGPHLRTLRARHDAATLAADWAEGHRMSQDRAIAYGLAEAAP